MKDITYFFDIGEIFDERNHGIIKITGRYVKNIPRKCRGKVYTKRQKRYTYQCLICGYNGDISEECLKYQNIGCPACSGRVPLTGKTDMWTTNPKLASLLKNPEDGSLYTEWSNKSVDWVCPFCNSIIYNKSISNVKGHGLYCEKCNDKTSYPNKYISTLLSYLYIRYYTEHVFKWSTNLSNDPVCSKKIYDFYLPNYNIIIEAHGIQHYEKNNLTSKRRTLEMEQLNDQIKKDLAISNGVHYFEIDCRYSDPDFISSNLVNSGLFNLLNIDISTIDFNSIKHDAEKSYIVCCYELWKKDNMSIDQLANIFHKSKSTIRNYLQRGNSIYREMEVKYG